MIWIMYILPKTVKKEILKELAKFAKTKWYFTKKKNDKLKTALVISSCQLNVHISQQIYTPSILLSIKNLNYWMKKVRLGPQKNKSCYLKERLERTKTYAKALHSCQDSLRFGENVMNLQSKVQSKDICWILKSFQEYQFPHLFFVLTPHLPRTFLLEINSMKCI